MTPTTKLAARSTQPRYLWHAGLHQTIAQEQLAFIFASFEPTYKRERALLQVKTALAGLSIRSYALWELIGDPDLLIQAWLPPGVTIPPLVAAIDSAIASPVSASFLPMTVDAFLWHWMWRDESLDLDEVYRGTDVSHFAELNGGASIPGHALRAYSQKRYLYPVCRKNTMKFFLKISPPRRAPMLASAQDDFASRIRTAVTNFTEIENASLMRVRGDGVAYLLTGRVDPRKFELISQELVPRLTEVGGLETLGSRTTTHLSAEFRAIDRREQLLPSNSADGSRARATEDTVKSLLAMRESEQLELKASAFTDINAKVTSTKTRRNADEQLHEVAKAVVGLLNCFGGRILIGVAEGDRFSLEGLSAAGFREPATFGENILIGVDFEFPNGSWDAYHRKLAQKLRGLIVPNPTGWLDVHDVSVGSHTVAVVEVIWPPRYFHLKDSRFDQKGNREPIEVFYGRSGAETLPLAGSVLENYRESHPHGLFIVGVLGP